MAPEGAYVHWSNADHMQLRKEDMTDAGPDFEALFNTLSVPYAVLDRDFRYVAISDMLEEAVSQPREDLVGRTLFELFPEIEERQEVIEAAFSAAFDGTPTSMAEVPYAIPIPGKPGKMREIWWTFHCAPIPDPSGEVRYIGFHADNITKAVEARELKDAIARELQHRVSNILSLVQVIARQTANQHDDVQDFLEVFDDRVHSLAQTHALLTGTNWDGLTLDALLTQQLAVHESLIGTRISFAGPTLLLSATEAQALSMAIHELLSNALKYGALSDEHGTIAISWEELGEDGFELVWTEDGLDNATAPDRKGFGTAILTRILPAQIRGKADQRFTTSSHVYKITVAERRNG